MGGLLHLVQQEGDWAGLQPAKAPPCCTKCNSPPINGQCTVGLPTSYYSMQHYAVFCSLRYGISLNHICVTNFKPKCFREQFCAQLNSDVIARADNAYEIILIREKVLSLPNFLIERLTLLRCWTSYLDHHRL